MPRLPAALAILLVAVVPARAAAAEPPAAEPLRAAAADYAAAWNARDEAALAAQWIANAELAEGGTRVCGRDAIVRSIRGWRERHPEATLALDVTDVESLTATLARVRGVMRFTPAPGAPPVASRFETLRVLDEGAWRIVESIVEPAAAAALDDLGWLVGSWQAVAADGTRIEAAFERAAGPFCILGRIRLRPAAGSPVEAVLALHPDSDRGLVRAWIVDSTGARADGAVASDGTALHLLLDGSTAPTAAGRRSRWVRMLMPTGADGFTMQDVDRTLDAMPLPDAPPIHFRKAP
jgi:uncharacterized protein (TIGR02246 family)